MKLNIMQYDDNIISEKRIGKGTEGSGHGLMCGSISAFRLEDRGNPRQTLSQDRQSLEGTWNHKLPNTKYDYSLLNHNMLVVTGYLAN